ncbi:MAG: PilW family protein [Candidatus Contendobacter sp.]|nr:PilW family protein [Candidatus Contendobacter sp.]MDG4558116.1 PilW family protein [Candidatus Contendobacter sp.]
MATKRRGSGKAGNATDEMWRAAGFTLIEILVTLSISAFLLSGVISIFLSSQQSYRVKEAMGRAQENLQLASEILSRTLSMAESLHPDSGPDQIIVNYTGGAGVVNCLGQPAPPGVVVNRFYVGNQALHCGTAYPAKPGSDQPLVEGMARMRIRYGVDERHRGQADRYVDAPGDWNQVVSARITLRLLDSPSPRHPDVVLTVAMRPRIFSRLP